MKRNPNVSHPTTAGLLLSGFALFVMLGMAHTSYGPAIPALRDRFAVGTVVAGFLPSAHFLGAVLGIGFAIVVGMHMPLRRLFGLTASGFVLGCLGVAFALGWPLTVVSAGLVGFGSAALQVGVIALFARRYVRRARTVLNTLHAFISVGFLLGPLGVAAVTAVTPTRPLLMFLPGAGIAAVAVWRLRAGTAGFSTLDSEGESWHREVSGPVALFGLMFFVYIGIEIGIGTWEATHLMEIGFGTSSAALLTSIFWAAYSGGRLLAAFVTERIGDGVILATSLAAAALALTLTPALGSPAIAYSLAGFALGPVWPTGLVWVNRRQPLSIRSTGVLMAGAMVGGVVFPPLLGWIVQSRGVAFLPPAMAVLAVFCLAMVLFAFRWREVRRLA